MPPSDPRSHWLHANGFIMQVSTEEGREKAREISAEHGGMSVQFYEVCWPCELRAHDRKSFKFRSFISGRTHTARSSQLSWFITVLQASAKTGVNASRLFSQLAQACEQMVITHPPVQQEKKQCVLLWRLALMYWSFIFIWVSLSNLNRTVPMYRCSVLRLWRHVACTIEIQYEYYK